MTELPKSRDALLAEGRALVAQASAPASQLKDVSLHALITECNALIELAPARVRTVHHFACSGGTIMSRCLAAQPNAFLLSEIDPLSQIGMKNPARFTPTDLLFHARQAPRELSQDSVLRVFLAGVRSLLEVLDAGGQYLILRDHAHSMFCTDVDPEARPALREILAQDLQVLSVVTVRHPLDAFLGLVTADWRHFNPFTLEEYARRMILFLDRHQGVSMVKYEDFTTDPEEALRTVCTYLDLPFDPRSIEINDLFQLSGDSGRRGVKIAPRLRRPVPPEVEAQRDNSPSYQDLCVRLKYAP